MIKFKELKRLKLRDGVLVQGLPGIGLAGKLAVDYIVRELKLTKVAELLTDGLLLQSNVAVFVDDEAIIRLPSYEFYLYEGARDALFVTAPSQPVVWQQYEVSEYILDYFQSIGGREVVAVCGTTMGDSQGVYFAAASQEVKEELAKLGFKPSPGGVITGACGLLPALAALRGLKAYVLMGYVTQPELDPIAAKHVVQALSKLLGFDISTSNLDLLMEELKKKEMESIEALKEAVKTRRIEGPPFYL
ncbi:MAG: PAC2 family protein [Thermofilaceae archaeon]